VTTLAFLRRGGFSGGKTPVVWPPGFLGREETGAEVMGGRGPMSPPQRGPFYKGGLIPPIFTQLKGVEKKGDYNIPGGHRQAPILTNGG